MAKQHLKPFLEEARRAAIATATTPAAAISATTSSSSASSSAPNSSITKPLLVVYNPVSGSGKAARTVRKIVCPLLDAAGVAYTVVATTHRGHAREILAAVDVAQCGGVLVAGGDGLVHEAVTGLLARPDAQTVAQQLPLGIIPSGTANAMANHLDGFASKSGTELAARVVLAAIKAVTTSVDAFSCTPVGGNADSQTTTTRTTSTTSKTSTTATSTPRFGLSVFGYGIGGAITKKADRMRWLPGQKRLRYDLAGLVSFATDWPVRCPAMLSYPVEGDDCDSAWLRGCSIGSSDSLDSAYNSICSDSSDMINNNRLSTLSDRSEADSISQCNIASRAPTTTTNNNNTNNNNNCRNRSTSATSSTSASTAWRTESVDVVNLIASKLPILGRGHPIHRHVTHNDGRIALTWMEGKEHTRMQMISSGLRMRSGHYLAEDKLAHSRLLREFILTPLTDHTDMLLDGDPIPAAAVHIKVLPGALKLFAPRPEVSSSPSSTEMDLSSSSASASSSSSSASGSSSTGLRSVETWV